MKSFVQYFLEYRHNLADGTPAPSIYTNNGKNPNLVGDKKYLSTKGEYKKDVIQLDTPGSILSFSNLETLGFKNLMDIQLPQKFDNVKNSGASILVYKIGNVIQGKVLTPSLTNK